MPGLYKNKRKRVSLNSSHINDDSVWHSTPLDLDSTGPESEDNNARESPLSPVKRPALGDGVRGRVVETPYVDQSQSPGPTSHELIEVPSAAVNIVFGEDGNENRNLFEDMEVDQQQQEQNNSPVVVRRDVAPSQRPPPSPQASLRTAVVPYHLYPPVRSQSVHLSQRFGPVEIHAPSGHGFFSSILNESGFVLTLPKNHLCYDVAMFREKMNNWMVSNTDANSRIDDRATKFLKAMKKYFTTTTNLAHACTTTLNDRECIQPSLLACLLGVPLLQKALLEVVLPALSESTYSSSQEEIDFVGTIVNQMKWLPVLVDGKGFAVDLLNILDSASIPAKVPIIRIMPDIFLPEHHPYLVPKLMEIFQIGTHINVTILDCFASLVVPEEDCMKTRRSAVVQMTSAPLEDLPAYVSFLFRVGSPLLHLEEGIKEMRDKLEIKPRFRIPKEEVLMVEILERIRFFVSVNPLIVKIWLSQLKDDLSMEIDLPALDMLMLLIFAETSNKAALSMLSIVFNRPNLTIALFDKIIENNEPMLHELFPTVARFLDSVLRIKGSKCHDAAIEVTKNLFLKLGPILSQHLTSNLISVLISGHPSCRDVALKVFTNIAKAEPKKLLYFHSYLMGALVYVIKYPPRQMQALMNILATLAFMPENRLGEENAFTAEFMILLRKQITHSTIRTKCFGVLGIIAAVRQLASSSKESNESRIDGLLALAWSSIENDEEACTIFFDEMISSIKVLPKNVCLEFRDILKIQFERLWTVDQSSNAHLLQDYVGQAGLDLVPTFDANKEMQLDHQTILVLEPRALEMSPLVVPCLMRVMAELEKACVNNLDDIDALIGCPVLFPSHSVYYEKDSLERLNYNQRLHLGQYLIVTLNYFRECVSAFVESSNPEMKVKVWIRLNNIVALQKSLVKHYEHFPNLPSAYGTEKNMTDNPGTSAENGPGFSGALIPHAAKKPASSNKKSTKKPKKVSKPKKKKTKKKKSADEDEDDEDIDPELIPDDEEATNTAKKSTLEELIQPKFIYANLRLLDPIVFSILINRPLKVDGETPDYTDILLNLSTATQSSVTMERIQRFNPETLALLLSEMKRQSLDKKCEFKILFVENLVHSLCQHVDAISDFYASQRNRNDDTDADDTEEQDLHNPAVDSCLRLLIIMLNSYFQNVSKEDKVKQRELMEKSIRTLGSVRSRSKDGNQEDEDVDKEYSEHELLTNASRYLFNFNAIVGAHDFETALEHIKLMKTIHDLIPHSDEMKQSMGKTVKSYLRRDWKLPSSAIMFFLKTWFSVTSVPMKVIEKLVENVFKPDDEDDSAIPNSSVYKSCTKVNFHTWYSTIFSSLAQHMHKLGRRKLNNFEENIEMWNCANNLLTELVQVSSVLKKTTILIPLLKFSRLYIEAFISCGVPLMPELWKRRFEDGHAFTKELQNSTRKIQAICEHSKVLKDNLLLRHVPPMKRTLETLIFKVREAIGSRGVANAFWLGSLKQRNLDGNVIDSQPFFNSQDDDSLADSVPYDAEEESVGTLGEVSDNEEENDEEDEEEMDNDSAVVSDEEEIMDDY